MTAVSSTHALIVMVSLAPNAVTSMDPSPGMENTLSTMALPAIIKPKLCASNEILQAIRSHNAETGDINREGEQEHEADPIIRQRHTDDAEQVDAPIRQAAFSAGGQHPQRNTEQSGKQERHGSHNQGGPDGRRQFFHNRPSSVIGVSEIPMQGIP